MSVIVRKNREIFPFLYQEIEKAKTSIYAALAWFTDPEILKLIIRKKNIDKVDVKIILFNDEINFILSQLRQLGESVRFSNIIKVDYIMHHKFCIIDNSKVITGSYNWTVKARRFNKENIVCIEDEEVVDSFISEFDNLLKNSEIQNTINKTQRIERSSTIENLEVLDLEQAYNKEIEKRIELIKNLNIGVDIKLAYELIGKRTPVIAASLLATAQGGDYIQPALIKLEDAGRLDLCFEESIIRKEYSILFDKNTQQHARQKLEKLNYFINKKYSLLWNDYV